MQVMKGVTHVNYSKHSLLYPLFSLLLSKQCRSGSCGSEKDGSKLRVLDHHGCPGSDLQFEGTCNIKQSSDEVRYVLT